MLFGRRSYLYGPRIPKPSINGRYLIGWCDSPLDNLLYVFFMNKLQEKLSQEMHREDTARQTLQQISESDHDYERFLREQTHQLKKLFQSIKVKPRTQREPNNFAVRSALCPYRDFEILPGRVVETIELSDLESRPFGVQSLRSARETVTGQNMRRSIPSRSTNIPRRSIPPLEYYRERRVEIEKALFIGGKGYETSREGISTISTAPQTGRRLHETRETQGRFKQNYRRYTRDRYRLNPSR